MAHGEIESAAAARASVLHIDDGDSADAHGAQRNLAADHVLALHMSLRDIGEERGLDVRDFEPRVGNRGLRGHARQRLDVEIQHPPERRHSDANNKYLFHAHLLPSANHSRAAGRRGLPAPI
ncbi:MAG: hypothetical protein M5U07_12145 [Xanthobacteraceae bacterium]|nr:hypothetical protein [Xanthobacteraceae bacterium]